MSTIFGLRISSAVNFMETILTKILFLLTVSFCFLSLACVQSSVETVPSDTVQSSQIYRIYTIEANKTRTEIAAAFRIGGATGTTVELTAPAQILYNNQAMPVSAPSNLIGTNYRMKGTDYRTFSGNITRHTNFHTPTRTAKTSSMPSNSRRSKFRRKIVLH